MAYEVVYEKAALRMLRKLQPKWQQRIRSKLQQVAENPYDSHNEVTKLQGKEGYRLRVGDWRVLYILEDEKLKLIALDIKPRGQAYKH